MIDLHDRCRPGWATNLLGGVVRALTSADTRPTGRVAEDWDRTTA